MLRDIFFSRLANPSFQLSNSPARSVYRVYTQLAFEMILIIRTMSSRYQAYYFTNEIAGYVLCADVDLFYAQ